MFDMVFFSKILQIYSFIQKLKLGASSDMSRLPGPNWLSLIPRLLMDTNQAILEILGDKRVTSNRDNRDTVDGRNP